MTCVRAISQRCIKATLSSFSGCRPCIMDAVSEINSTFALCLFKMLCEDNPSHNVLFSPASLSWAWPWSCRGQKGTPLPRLPRSAASLWSGDRLAEFSGLLLCCLPASCPRREMQRAGLGSPSLRFLGKVFH